MDEEQTYEALLQERVALIERREQKEQQVLRLRTKLSGARRRKAQTGIKVAWYGAESDRLAEAEVELRRLGRELNAIEQRIKEGKPRPERDWDKSHHLYLVFFHEVAQEQLSEEQYRGMRYDAAQRACGMARATGERT